MRFLPVSETDRAEMLRAIGVPSAQNLFLRRRPDSRT